MRILVAAVTASLGAAFLVAGCSGGDTTREPGVLQGPYPVVRAVDGDTIRVTRDGQEISVRLIGIDTPETVAQDQPIECFGPEASARTKELVTGQSVWLEYDAASGETDKYGRTLAYVWISPESMLNELLVREGLAEEYTYSDEYHHQETLQRAEQMARAAGTGLWTACP